MTNLFLLIYARVNFNYINTLKSEFENRFYNVKILARELSK